MKRFGLLFALCGYALAQTTAPQVTSIRATQQNGQTYVTWVDADTGANGNNYRYNVFRATGGGCPITAGNVGSATLVIAKIMNNSGQINPEQGFTQTWRQDNSNSQGMNTFPGDGSPLASYSGLAIYTNKQGDTSPACYAVRTCDASATNTVGQIQNGCSGATYTQSGFTTGGNSMAGTVAESTGTITPYIAVAGSSGVGSGELFRCAGAATAGVCNASPSDRTPSHTGKPAWFRLHASGGFPPGFGDLWAFWGDTTMGFSDGVQMVFDAYEDNSSGQAAYTGQTATATSPYQLLINPEDRIWTVNALSPTFSGETYWLGNIGAPLLSANQTFYLYDWTYNKLSVIFPFVIAHYSADTNHVYCWGKSMGGHGASVWMMRQNPPVCAGIFLQVPVIGPWFSNVNINGSTVSNSGVTLPDGVSTVSTLDDPVAYISGNCQRNVPYISFSAGRLDTTLASNQMWGNFAAFVNALEACHYGYSADWNGGDHTNGDTAQFILSNQAYPLLTLNQSYPAFTSFSLNDSLGCSSTSWSTCEGLSGTGACNGAFGGNTTPGFGPTGTCYHNYGFSWTLKSDTSTSWQASFTNSLVSSSATANVTPRNTQAFSAVAGQSASWSICITSGSSCSGTSGCTGSCSGTVTADTYGLVTAPVQLSSGLNTILTVTLTQTVSPAPANGLFAREF